MGDEGRQIMQALVHTRTSTSDRGHRALVTVLLGKPGSGQRSVSRHVRYMDGSWIGFNPDPLAIQMRMAADAVIATVNAEIAEATEMVVKATAWVAEKKKGQVKLAKAALKVVQARLTEATANLSSAKKSAEEVYRQWPEKVEFVGV